MVHHPAVLDLPHAVVEWLTMLIVNREGDHRCKLPPHQRALVALVYLRKHEPLTQITVAFGISVVPHTPTPPGSSACSPCVLRGC